MMARSNPYKKPKRSAKQTVLFYCEGENEEVFLGYLKSVFSKDTGISVTIKSHGGGSADEVALGAIRRSVGFNRTFAVFDLDCGGLSEEVKSLVERERIFLLESNPCLEAMLLSILEGKDFSYRESDWCKKEFEKKYLNERKRMEKRNYEKFFPLTLLVSKKKSIKWIDDIISGMTTLE